MKIEFSSDVSADMRKLFAKVFDLATQRLGISDFNKTLVLHIGEDEMTTKMNALGVLGPLQDSGAMRLFGMALRPNDDMYKLLVVFCHEMIHLKQWCYGEFGVVDNGPAYMNVPEAAWGGKEPWEDEAYEKMHPLANWIVGRLEK